MPADDDLHKGLRDASKSACPTPQLSPRHGVSRPSADPSIKQRQRAVKAASSKALQKGLFHDENDDQAGPSINKRQHVAPPPPPLLQDKSVGLQKPQDLILCSAFREEAGQIDQEPMVMASIVQVEAGIIACSEAMRKLRKTLIKVVESCGGTKQLLVILNAFAKTSDGKMTLFGCQMHTGFESECSRSMSKLRNVMTIDHNVKNHDDFHKVFSPAFGSTDTVKLQAMKLIKTITEAVMDKESMASRRRKVPPQFASALAKTKTTVRSCYTPVSLGESATEMDGTVFHLRTIVDNGEPGSTCCNTNTVTGNIQDNTCLRILIDQEGIIDMSK